MYKVNCTIQYAILKIKKKYKLYLSYKISITAQKLELSMELECFYSYIIKDYNITKL